MRQYEDAGIPARWLDAEKAAHAYEFACEYVRPDRYGLREDRVAGFESLQIQSDSAASAWVAARFPAAGTVQIVYGPGEVCVIEAEVLRKSWLSLFVPGRDDAIVLHNLTEAALFICHESELEFGYRRPLSEFGA